MKKSFLYAFFTICFAFSLCLTAMATNEIPEQTEIKEAENVTEKVDFLINESSDDIGKLTDDDASTYVGGANDNTFTISVSSEVSIHGIYIKWNGVPAKWQVSSGSDSDNIKEYTGEFLHSFIELNGEKEVQISWADKNGSLAEIFVFSEGQVPSWVQKWDAPCEKADMLLIPTHPDDELLFFGGTMATYAGEKGLKVQVGYMTYAGIERYHELLDGLWTSGVKNYPIVPDFPDKYSETLEEAKNGYDENEIMEYFVELIRRFKPEVVIGHDINGEYGHGAHMLNSEILRNALPLAKDETVYYESLTEYGVWEVKKCYLHLYSENKIEMLWDTPLEAFDGKTAAEIAELSWNKHVSQQHLFNFKVDGRYGCAYFGLFHTTVGLDVNLNDFMENIPLESLTTYVAPEEDSSADNLVEGQPIDSSLETFNDVRDLPSAPSTGEKLVAAGLTCIVSLGIILGGIGLIQRADRKRKRLKKQKQM